MQKRMEHTSIWAAIHAAKQELGKVPKDSTNPFFKSKYFDINGLLDVVEPILHKHGLFCIQPIQDSKVTTRIVQASTGDSIASELQLSGTNDPQKHGSEITYYRRYTLQSLLAMQADDDDGNAASKRTPPPAPAKAPAKPTLTEGSDLWNKAISKVLAGETTIEKIKQTCIVSEAIEAKLKEAILNA
jgi:hypothetical protein